MFWVKVVTVLIAASVSVGNSGNTQDEKASSYIEFIHFGTQDGAWPALIISTHPIPQTIASFYNDVVDIGTYRRLGNAIKKSGCTRAWGRGIGPAGTFLVSEYSADGAEKSWCRSDPKTSERIAIRICRIYRRAGIKSKITEEYKNLLAIRADLQGC